MIRLAATRILSRSFSAAPPLTRIEEVRSVVHERTAGRARFYDKVSVVVGSTVDAPHAPSVITGGIDDSDAGVNHVGLPSSFPSSSSSSPSSSSPYYTITLDSNELRSPKRHPFHLPTFELASSIAIEWERQGKNKMKMASSGDSDAEVDSASADYENKTIEPTTMPLMTLAATAVDQIGVDAQTENVGLGRAKVEESVVKYLLNDTACYIAEDTESERALRRKQKDVYKNLHAFAEEELGGKLDIANGFRLGALKHSEELVANACLFVGGLSGWELSAMQSITMESKSFLVGMGLVKNFLTGDEAVALSRIEEEFQLESWGLVEGGHDMDRLNCGVQIQAAAYYLTTIKEDE